MQLSVSTGRRGNAGGYSVSVATVEDHRGARRFGCGDTDAAQDEGQSDETSNPNRALTNRH